MGRGQQGIRILVAGDEIYRRFFRKQIEQFQKRLHVSRLSGHITGDAHDIIIGVDDSVPEPHLLRPKFQPMQVADMQDAEILKSGWQCRHRDALADQVHPVIIDMVKSQCGGNHQHQQQRQKAQRRMTAFFRGKKRVLIAFHQAAPFHERICLIIIYEKAAAGKAKYGADAGFYTFLPNAFSGIRRHAAKAAMAFMRQV